MDKFLHTYNHPKWNQEDTDQLKRPETSNDIEVAIESPQNEKSKTLHIHH
jgi:hypothetical protein